MHKKAVVGVLGVVALLAAATSAEAGFLTISLDSPHGDPGSAINIGEDGNANVAVGEIFQQGQFVYELNVSGMTDTDPVMSITKTIENTTGLDWIGYQVDLDPGGTATFTGTPSSDVFSIGESSATSISFVAPGTVPSGGGVSINFDVLVPDTGEFGFTLTQTAVPIPEPGTLLLGLLAAGAGTAVTLRYRWG